MDKSISSTDSMEYDMMNTDTKYMKNYMFTLTIPRYSKLRIRYFNVTMTRE